jgi:hypothetical protein
MVMVISIEKTIRMMMMITTHCGRGSVEGDERTTSTTIMM